MKGEKIEGGIIHCVFLLNDLKRKWIDTSRHKSWSFTDQEAMGQGQRQQKAMLEREMKRKLEIERQVRKEQALQAEIDGDIEVIVLQHSNLHAAPGLSSSSVFDEV